MALETGGSLYWHTKIDNTGLKTGAVQAKGILRGLTRSITGMDIFAGLAIGATLVFTKIIKSAYNFSKNFETAMKEVQTISKAVQDNFKGISQEIIDMSKTVPDTALKLTKALYQIVSAGYDGAKAMEILRVSTELAVATVTDTFTAADVLTYVMNAYGIAAGTAAEISDKLFTIVKLGKVKMDELGPSLSMVTGLAAEAGMKFNDLAAFFAEAVKKIQPHIVSTGIRGFVTALLRAEKEGSQAADAARKLGIEFDMTTLKSKGLWYMLDQMSNATKENKAALMELFPNVRGLIGLLAIMTDEGEAFNKTLNAIETSLGNNTKAFKIMMETTESQMAILKNTVMAKLKPLGDEILGFMNDIARGINRAASGANDELSKLARTYSELTDTLQRKKSRIDDLIVTIENLRDKTELTEEEAINLKVAEKALITLLPDLGKAFEDAAGKVDILTLAKRGSLEVSLEIMELELALAKIAKEQADVALARFELGIDEASKGVEKLEEKVESWYENISVRQTSYIRELFRTMKMYPLDPYTKQIDALIEIYEGAGISVRNFGERIKDIQKDMKAGEDTTKEQRKLIEEVTDALFARDKGLEETRLDLASAELELGEAETRLRLNVKKTTEELNIRTEAYEKFKEAISKPIITPKPEWKYGLPPEIPADVIIPTLTDEQIKAVEDNLKYMASRYKKYLSDVAEFGIEDVKKRNALLVEEGENYAKFLSDMLADYEGNAELNRQISDDIYEYNNGLITRRKEAEEELFNLLADDREKDLAAEEKRFKDITKYYEEGTEEYEAAVIKHEENILKIKTDYANKEAEAKLAIFKAGWEKQIGEEKEAYVRRLEAKLKELESEKVIDIKRVEFIRNRLNIIRILEKAESDRKKEILDSYLSAYKTMEEKIAVINAETAKALKATSDEVTKNRIKNIEKQRIAAVKFADAKQKIDEKIAEYGENLNNEQLENLIKVLEEMKIKYKEFPDLVIYLNEKIAESQKSIWENTRDEINKTINVLHALADVVGNFDTELEKMINDIANLVSGIGDIKISFAVGDIAGVLTGILGIINTIINLFVIHKSDVPELRKELAEITLELQKQQNILSQAIGTAKIDAIKDTIALLEEQIDTYNEMIAAEEAAYGQFLWWTWDETDAEKIEQWLSSIEATEAEIVALWQQYREILTGVTATSIADAIADGFAQGMDSAQVFADTFNDMMKKAIIDAFKRTIITKFIEDWYEQFALLSEGGLTAEEIENLAGSYQDMIDAAEEQWEAMQDILDAAGISLEDITEAAEEGLTGAIAGITEETAGLLAGQFQAIRINTVDILSNMESIIIINARIADNTEYNKYLKDINDKLSEGTPKESEYLRGVGGV